MVPSENAPREVSIEYIGTTLYSQRPLLGDKCHYQSFNSKVADDTNCNSSIYILLTPVLYTAFLYKLTNLSMAPSLE
jgi:hypothetical protein